MANWKHWMNKNNRKTKKGCQTGMVMAALFFMANKKTGAMNAPVSFFLMKARWVTVCNESCNGETAENNKGPKIK